MVNGEGKMQSSFTYVLVLEKAKHFQLAEYALG